VPKVDGLVKRLVREEPLLSDSTKDAWIREVSDGNQLGIELLLKGSSVKRHCHVWETENLVRPGWEAITIHYGNFHHPTSFQAQLANFAQELPLKTWFVIASDFAGHGKWPMRNR